MLENTVEVKSRSFRFQTWVKPTEEDFFWLEKTIIKKCQGTENLSDRDRKGWLCKLSIEQIEACFEGKEFIDPSEYPNSDYIPGELL